MKILNVRKKLFILGVIFIFSVSLQAEIVIVYLKGKVLVRSLNRIWEKAHINQKLSPGDYIRTKRKSYAEVSINKGKLIRLKPLTTIQIGKSHYSSVNLKKVYLKNGTLLSKVVKGNHFYVLTPNAIISVIGTEFETEYSASNNTTKVVTYQGTVEVLNINNPDKKIKVAEGYQTQIVEDTPPSQPKNINKSQQTNIKIIDVLTAKNLLTESSHRIETKTIKEGIELTANVDVILNINNQFEVAMPAGTSLKVVKQNDTLNLTALKVDKTSISVKHAEIYTALSESASTNLKVTENEAYEIENVSETEKLILKSENHMIVLLPKQKLRIKQEEGVRIKNLTPTEATIQSLTINTPNATIKLDNDIEILSKVEDNSLEVKNIGQIGDAVIKYSPDTIATLFAGNGVKIEEKDNFLTITTDPANINDVSLNVMGMSMISPSQSSIQINTANIMNNILNFKIVSEKGVKIPVSKTETVKVSGTTELKAEVKTEEVKLFNIKGDVTLHSSDGITIRIDDSISIPLTYPCFTSDHELIYQSPYEETLTPTSSSQLTK